MSLWRRQKLLFVMLELQGSPSRFVSWNKWPAISFSFTLEFPYLFCISNFWFDLSNFSSNSIKFYDRVLKTTKYVHCKIVCGKGNNILIIWTIINVYENSSVCIAYWSSRHLYLFNIHKFCIVRSEGYQASADKLLTLRLITCLFWISWRFCGRLTSLTKKKAAKNKRTWAGLVWIIKYGGIYFF